MRSTSYFFSYTEKGEASCTINDKHFLEWQRMSSISNSNQIKFGTDGWRGIIADDFTFPNVRKVTRAIASYLETAYSKDRPVLVAYDTRFQAEKFAYTAAEALAELGWNVMICDRDCPTPVIAYNARHLNSAGALMFTASHNPAPYCGIKYIPDYAGPATPEITDTIGVTFFNESNAIAITQVATIKDAIKLAIVFIFPSN
jgi:phosphomannomutase